MGADAPQVVLDQPDLFPVRVRILSRVSPYRMLHFNVTSGAVCFSAVDFSLPGLIPFDFERDYKSDLNLCGHLGWNWTTPLDVALLWADSGFSFRDQWGHLHTLQNKKSATPEDRLFLFSNSGRDLIVTTPGDSHWHFFEARDGYLVRSLEDSSGNAITFDYGSTGLVQVITDSLGRRIAVHHHGRRVKEFEFISDARDRSSNSLVRYSYDRSDNLIAVQDANGNSCHFEYSAHLIVRYENRNGGSQYAAYDVMNRCANLWLDGGERAKRVRYDDRRRTAAVTDSRGSTAIYRWNEAGSVTEQVNALGGVTSNIFDDANSLISSLDEIGNPKLTALFDEQTRTLTVTHASGATTILEEDDHGRLLRQVDACGAEWRWFYDHAGRVERVIWPSGSGITLSYDSQGFLSSRTDRSGNTVTQARAGDGTRVTVADSLGLLMEYSYDPLGRFVGARDGNGEFCSLTLDAGGRIQRCVWPDNSEVLYSYDAEGNPVSVIDELGSRSSFRLDAFGKCLDYTNPLGESVTFRYGSEGEIVAISNERGERNAYEYDALGRVIRQVFFDGSSESYSYGDRGELFKLQQGDGSFINLIYDPDGRIIAKKYSDGTSDHFSYDALRRLVAASNPTTTLSLKWDPDGNLVQETQGDHTLDHFFDLTGNRVQSKDSRGRTVRYSYDARGRLISIADSMMGRHGFEYDSANLLRRHELPNKALLEFDYDPRKRTIAQRLSVANDLELTASYTFDSGNRLISQRTFAGSDEQMSYDSLDRVLSVSRTGHATETYAYDLAGNLTQVPIANNLSYAEGNRLITLNESSIDYDNCGSLTGIADSTQLTSFVYDVAGRLTSIARDGVIVASYSYDPLGRRVSKNVDGVTTTFQWDGFVLFGEASASNRIEYLFDEQRFLPLSRTVSGQAKHFVADRRGCIAATLDDSGKLTGTSDFNALGAIRNSSGEISEHPFRLLGQYADPESGLYYNLQRYYQPSTGRFLTRDPLGIIAGLNGYRYGPNTFTWQDPFGLTGECQGDVFYRAMSDEEKAKVLADCQLHARETHKCPEGPYVTQERAYIQRAQRRHPKDYPNVAEICTQPGTADAMQSAPFAGPNGSQTGGRFSGMAAVVSGQVDRIELKMEKDALNYGLSKGKGLKLFNSKVESMKFTPSGETCAK